MLADAFELSVTALLRFTRCALRIYHVMPFELDMEILKYIKLVCIVERNRRAIYEVGHGHKYPVNEQRVPTS